MWFLFALITTLAWGGADLFYKRAADEKDPYSHLKTTMIVGFVMGIHAIVMLLATDMHYDLINLLLYLPVSAAYILSMAIGYFGLRYLELSISSPIQNSSGAITALLCLVILGQTMGAISAVGVVLICIGVFVLGMTERSKTLPLSQSKKYSTSIAAIIIPIIYCVVDALGTFLDAYYLDDINTTLLRNVTEDTFENVANTSYELTFLLVAIGILVFLLMKRERVRIPAQRDRAFAALLETGGQFTYVYAMSGSGVVAAPMISAYCIVSLIFSRIFLKEKLTFLQIIAVIIVTAGIILMGISEGLAG